MEIYHSNQTKRKNMNTINNETDGFIILNQKTDNDPADGYVGTIEAIEHEGGILIRATVADLFAESHEQELFFSPDLKMVQIADGMGNPGEKSVLPTKSLAHVFVGHIAALRKQQEHEALKFANAFKKQEHEILALKKDIKRLRGKK